MIRLLPIASLALLASCATTPALVAGPGAPAPTGARSVPTRHRAPPILDGLGDHHHGITTSVPRAQRYFDQGLALYYAFNPGEAERSFREAVRLDPNCGMCWWGAALAAGPQLNAPMDDTSVPRTFEALQAAIDLGDRVSDQERAYIFALARRYVPAPVPDRTALDHAYAEAMIEVSRRWPEDSDAAVLAAEARMIEHPWDYWGADGQPRPWTPEIETLLEGALARDPDSVGANHFYIHVVEGSPTPERALPCAQRLPKLAPGAGHLVHMASHVYLRIGRYHEAAEINEQAVHADEAYLQKTDGGDPTYRRAYVPHALEFLWTSFTWEGRSSAALRVADELALAVDPERLREPAFAPLQRYLVAPYLAWVRFGRWKRILAAPEPDRDLPYVRAFWHYARAVALARSGAPDQAAAEVKALERLAADPSLEGARFHEVGPVDHQVRLAAEVAAGEVEAARGDYEQALVHLRAALDLESSLAEAGPPAWHQPVREVLGAVLLAAGRPAEAERAYRDDLARHPDNGWSLRGLVLSLQAQGRAADAAATEDRFRAAWKYADVELPASRF